jgi:hypothetical protein
MLVIIRSTGAVVDCGAMMSVGQTSPPPPSARKANTPRATRTANQSTPATTSSCASGGELSNAPGTAMPTAATPAVAQAPSVPIATPFACAVGLIQRLLLTANEKVLPRQTVSTITELLLLLLLLFARHVKQVCFICLELLCLYLFTLLIRSLY